MGGANQTRRTDPHTHTCGDISKKRERDPSPKQIAEQPPITKQHTDKHTYMYPSGGVPRQTTGCVRGVWRRDYSRWPPPAASSMPTNTDTGPPGHVK